MTRYACTNYGCPTREPVTAASPPICYTCARPMAAVRGAADLTIKTSSPVAPELERDIAELAKIQEWETHSELSPNELIARDRLIYGTGYGRRHKDGRIEHIPAMEMLVERRQASTMPSESGNTGSNAIVGGRPTTTGGLAASGGTGGGGSGQAIAITNVVPFTPSALSEHIILIRANSVESAITIDHKPTIVDYGTGYGRSLSFDSRASLDTVALLNGLYHKRTPFAVECGALFKSSCVLIGSYTVRTAASGLVIVEIEFRAIGDAP